MSLRRKQEDSRRNIFLERETVQQQKHDITSASVREKAFVNVCWLYSGNQSRLDSKTQFKMFTLLSVLVERKAHP